MDANAHTCMSSERVRTTTTKRIFAERLGIYLLPNDFGEFLLVLKNGPDEECLQGMPSDGRHILGGVRAGSQHLSRHTSIRRKMGSGCPREHPMFGGPVTWCLTPFSQNRDEHFISTMHQVIQFDTESLIYHKRQCTSRWKSIKGEKMC